MINNRRYNRWDSMAKKWGKYSFACRVVGGILIFICILFHFFQFKRYNEKSIGIKYILQWTKLDTIPFALMGSGHQTFVDRKCIWQNCYVTGNREYFEDVTNFDAVLFHGPEIVREKWKLPFHRSPKQKYVFVSWESSHYYKVKDSIYDNFFNWTWTFRLDSDIPLTYLIVRDIEGNIIGPKETMHWINIDEMKPTTEEVKKNLYKKKNGAAWFVSNCNSKSKRENLVKNLNIALGKYNISVDVYGPCGKFVCPRPKMKECLEKIKNDYYFYMSLENSFNEDYVTEKLLHALQNYAVPIVYGGANYTRFMPDGIYLDAKKLNITELAQEMNDIIKDRERYYDFFKWHNHYSYHGINDEPDSDAFCRFCALLNNPDLTNKTTVYKHFRNWW